MKKILFLSFSLILLTGCDKDYTEVVEPVIHNYQVTSITAPAEFDFTRTDSVRIINLIFDNTSEIKEVSYSFFSPSGSLIKSAAANKISSVLYSFPLNMSVNYSPGRYTIKYFVTDISDRKVEIAIHTFNYRNIYYINDPPVISDILIEPDTVVVNDTTFITIMAEVTDQNSRQDIELVYFIVFRPDGTTNGNQVPLFDDGVKDQFKWDMIPDDGIFSRVIRVDQTNMKGTYRFEFRARDRGKELSETVSYNVLIQ